MSKKYYSLEQVLDWITQVNKDHLEGTAVMQLTNNEKIMIRNILTTCYGYCDGFCMTSTWTFECFNIIGGTKGRGVLSSLIKKGLIEMYEYEKPKDMVQLTEIRQKIAKDQGILKENEVFQ